MTSKSGPPTLLALIPDTLKFSLAVMQTDGAIMAEGSIEQGKLKLEGGAIDNAISLSGQATNFPAGFVTEASLSGTATSPTDITGTLKGTIGALGSFSASVTIKVFPPPRQDRVIRSTEGPAFIKGFAFAPSNPDSFMPVEAEVRAALQRLLDFINQRKIRIELVRLHPGGELKPQLTMDKVNDPALHEFSVPLAEDIKHGG